MAEKCIDTHPAVSCKNVSVLYVLIEYPQVPWRPYVPICRQIHCKFDVGPNKDLGLRIQTTA